MSKCNEPKIGDTCRSRHTGRRYIVKKIQQWPNDRGEDFICESVEGNLKNVYFSRSFKAPGAESGLYVVKPENDKEIR